VGLTYSSLACDNLTFHRDEKKRRGDRRLTAAPDLCELPATNAETKLWSKRFDRSAIPLKTFPHETSHGNARRDIRLPVYHSKTIEIEIGAKLKELRLQAGMSQDKFGTAMGVSHTQVQKYEQGKNRIAVFDSRGNL
jgi:DNA-binding transcriptional regulator YiaG